MAKKKRCPITDCPVYHRREIPFDGNKCAKVVIMGESAGPDEERQGKQFVGDTGHFIKSRVTNAGLFGQVMWMNAARCRIDKNEVAQKEITQILKTCRPNVERVLQKLRPKVIFLMGGLAMQQILKKKGVKNNRGKWIWSKEFGCWCIATWHPGYIFRQRAFEPEFDQDFRKLTEFVENGYSPPTDDVEKDYREIQSIRDLLDLADTKRVVCGFDTEDQGLDWVSPNFIPMSYSVSWENSTGYHIQLYEEAQEDQDADLWIKWPRYMTKRKKEVVDVPVRKAASFDQKLKELQEFISHSNICKVMQHGSFDQHCVDRLFTMNGLPRPEWKSYIADVQAMAHCLNENLYVMANITKLQYGFTNIREDYNAKFDSAYDKSDMLAIPREPIAYYAGADADTTRQVFLGEWKVIKKSPSLVKYYKKFVHPALTKIIYALEHYGVAVDTEKLPDATAKVKKIRDEHEQGCLSHIPKKVKDKHKEKGLQLTRRDIIRDALFSEDGFGLEPIKLTDTRQPSADKDSLKEIASKARSKKLKGMIEEYQQFSEYDMLWSRYLKGFAKHIRSDGRVHPSISNTAAVTGRLGTRDPNLMAIPKRSKAAPIVRRLIVPQKGYVFVLIDESQSELRLLAEYSNDPTMISVFANGEDIHTATAQEIVRMTGKRWRDLSAEEIKVFRTRAKSVNFGVIYLMTPNGLVNYAKSNYSLDLSQKQAKLWMDSLFNKYPKVKEYHRKYIEFARRNGYVESLLGRRRRLPEINSKDDYLRWEAERQAVNFPIQSMSSDMVLMAGNMIVDKGFPEDEIRPVVFIHDELIFEVREDKVDEYVPHIVHAMENPPLEEFGIKLKVPLLAEPKWGHNASDTETYEPNCNRIAKEA